MNKIIVFLILLISADAFALNNDKYGRTVTVNTANGLDTYTDVDPNNSNSTFTMSFTAGTALTVVYPALESQAPPGSLNYAGLDASSIVLGLYFGPVAYMNGLVSAGTISSFQALDPTFPPPLVGDTFAGAGIGYGNFMKPLPYLAKTPSNWPPPGGVPNVIPGAIDQLAGRLATVNPTTPARSLNSTFTPNANRPVFACYTVRVSCTIAAAGNCNGNAQLLSDTSNPPTTVRAESAVSISGPASTVMNEVPLCYMVPTGANVQIKTNTTTGSPAFTLVQQTEENIH